MSSPAYRLLRPDAAVAVPVLDEQQRAVVDHRDGPLLVLAGPGTGKTTTLVEAVVARIEEGVPPDQILALTFSRKAAEQLRDRVTARLGRTLTTGLCATFHSFAYSLVRHYAPAEIYAAPLRLLSAPEQDVVLRELLTDHPESVRWPQSLGRALGTRGFAREVNAVLSRAREKGHDGAELRVLGEQHGAPELVAAGLFLDQYLDTLDSVGATDYADLIRRSVIEAAEHRDELRARFRHVFVDEYQDTDPGQVALLRQLAGDGRDLVVVGDPHQSIYGFRGAEVRGILDFPSAFPRSDGRPADVVALRTTRRFGTRVLVASQRVAGRLSLPGSIPPEAREAFLHPVTEAEGEGRVVVRTFDTERSEAEHLADLLRRAHLEDGVAWDEMAVLVRSGRTSIPPLRRALGAAGVPVEVTSDEVPLVRDPAVLPLLEALRAVVNLDNDDVDHVDHVHSSRAEALLLSPLGGLDAGDLRRLGRALRQRAKAEAQHADRPPPPSADLVRRAVVQHGFLDGLAGGEEVARATALAGLLARGRAALDAGSSAEEVLWLLWSGTGWPERLRHATEAGGGAARHAHRDLDSICALFEVVGRAEQQRVHLGVADLLATLTAQQIPADTLAERGARGAAVRLLTAHRAKGLEWRLVVVAHVQQEAWPDLRRRASLLQPDRIGTDGLVAPITARELLLEERRLFYVACTRARERLVVTAVRSPDDDGEQPSRFLDELELSVEHVVGRPARPLSTAGIVAELRRRVADPATPEPVRRAAARRLARLAGATAGRRRLVPQADPSTWWGTRAATSSTEPLRSADQPVPISASLLESVGECPTRWFLEREAGGSSRAHQAVNLGEILHALADRVAHGELRARRRRADGARRRGVGPPGVPHPVVPGARARAGARRPRPVRAVARRQRAGRCSPPSSGSPPWSRCPTARRGGRRPAHRVGRPTRARRRGAGRRGRPQDRPRQAHRQGSVTQHVQLGLYQYAVDSGAVDDLVGDRGPAAAGGAELVQLGILDDAETAVVQRQDVPQPDGPERPALRERIGHAARLLRDGVVPRLGRPAVPRLLLQPRSARSRAQGR